MVSRKRCGKTKFIIKNSPIVKNIAYLCRAEQSSPGSAFPAKPTCQEYQYDIYACVYWFSMAFAGLSTVLVYKKEKCLVKSVQDIHFYLFFMVVRPRVLWTYVQGVYGHTSIDPLNELEWEWTKPAWNPLILNSLWTRMNGTEVQDWSEYLRNFHQYT